MAQYPAQNTTTQAEHTAVEIGAPSGSNYPPQNGKQRLKSARKSFDGSNALFALYNRKVADFDREFVGNWTEHIRDLIVLSGLVSAAIAAFLAPAFIATLSRAPDDSVFLLSQILEVQAFQANLTTVPATPLNFGPSSTSTPSATQILWFCGLAMSLSSALLAMLLQSWIRRYMAMTQPRQRPRSRALIQAYVRLERSLDSLQLIMDGLHLLLDTAIFTFLAGLVWLLSLTSLDFSVSLAVSVPSPLLFLGYFFFTWTSFHRHTIYSTPCSRVIRNLRLRLRDIPQYCNALFHPPGRNAFIAFHWLKLDGIDQVADQLIKCRPSLLNEIVAWLLHSLDHDKDIERFLESIPGVYDSGLVEQPEQVFRPFHEDQVPHMILSFMHHTISSATVPDNIKQRRIRLSLQVMELDPYLLERTFFYALSLPAKPTIFQCIDFVLVAYRVASNTNANPETQLLAKCIIAVSRLTSNDYERLLRSSISTSDTTPDRQLTSKKLDSLVFLMGLLHSASPQYRDEILPETLFAACNFPTENVSPESRSRFCETALADVVPFLTSSDEHRMLIVYCSSCPGPRYCSQSS